MRQVIIYQDEDGMWITEVPSLPGCGSEGKTREEALRNTADAIQLWIDCALEDGESIPEDYPVYLESIAV
ncbi:MAG: type II toxin-antitoxin system HicB family antitoxin [Anaerolineae bacterium]|nr:type II toxin-antitoxin system HicB family antitoxin [Anaerolineae bacterium]MCK6578303.1 type II toxin-antitoxin system HicB family antitoxin [Anaerolineae bacterium]NUQ06787.1 type II toxin-antitoxin system HicB family antitoxin [Anaerolineae bacterium]